MSVRSKEDPDCLEYAQQHTIMLILLLLFFGVLVVPRFYDQVQYARFQKTDGIVKTIYYSQYAPMLSFVEITYNLDKKDYTIKEMINQHVQVGDHVELYVSKDRKSIQFQRQSLLVSSLFLLSYFIVLFFCFYKIYSFFFTGKK